MADSYVVIANEGKLDFIHGDGARHLNEGDVVLIPVQSDTRKDELNLVEAFIEYVATDSSRNIGPEPQYDARTTTEASHGLGSYDVEASFFEYPKDSRHQPFHVDVTGDGSFAQMTPNDLVSYLKERGDPRVENE